jgi:hypothetical protein
MTIFKTFSLLIALTFNLFIASTAVAQEAPTLLISDIDDTLKNSHVLDHIEILQRALSLQDFAQMSALYQTLAGHGVQFYYVTTAPKQVMAGLHQKFLENNKFPKGSLLLPNLGEKDFKVRTITQILNERRPQRVIMIGDNGEKDVLVYQAIEQAFRGSGIEFITFIRVAYPFRIGLAPAATQHGFVATGEIALPLYRAGFLTASEAQALVHQSLGNSGLIATFEDLLHSGLSLGLPYWVNCRDHRADLREYQSLSLDVEKLQNKINSLCTYLF